MKFFDDILKENNKYSLKRVIILTSFIFVIYLGSFITISDKILEKEVNRYAIDVFNSILLFLISLLGISETGKKFLNKNVPEENP